MFHRVGNLYEYSVSSNYLFSNILPLVIVIKKNLKVENFSKETETYFTNVLIRNASHLNYLSCEKTTTIILALKTACEYGKEINVGLMGLRF